MQIKIQHLNFSRNGVHGTSFYTAHIDLHGERLIVTFELNEDNKIDLQSCRVVNPLKPFDDYKGDEIAYELQKKIGERSIYDLIGSLKYPEINGSPQKARTELYLLGCDGTLYGESEVVRLQSWQSAH